MTAEPSLKRPRSRRRRMGLSIVTILVLGAAGAGTWFITNTGNNSKTVSTQAGPAATAKVTRGNLAETQTVDGTLGYGDTFVAISGVKGVITSLPAEGAVVSKGRAIYRVGDEPVVVMYGGVPLYRTLRSGVEGADVKEFEANLSSLGYGGFNVDDTYTDSTASAVKTWQNDLGMNATGVIDPGRIFMVPGPVRVTDLQTEASAHIAPGQPVLTYTGTVRVVTIDLDVNDQNLAKKGAKVTVTLPDSKQLKGTISIVGTVAHDQKSTSGSSQPSSSSDTSTIDVTVTVDDQAAAGDLDAAPVTVDLVSEEHDNVLAVPVSALLALREGGYGVNIVDGNTTRLVAVKVGIFSGGLVEVKGPDITEGVRVEVPKS